MARNDLTDYVIEVLEGPASGAVVPLTGRELPYRAGAGGSLGYGRTMRSKLTWYPGNRVASQQIIGPILKPTTIDGTWKDRYLGTDRAIDLVDLFEELLDSGVQLRVSWSTIVRQGIVKDVDWKPGVPTGGLGDIGWTIVFEWNSAGEPPRRRVGESDIALRSGLVRAANAVASIGETLNRAVKSFNFFVGLVRISTQSIRRTIDDIVEAFAQPLETLAFSAARLGDEPNLPARFVEDASAAAASAQDNAGLAADTISAIFPGAVTIDDGLESILGDALDRFAISEEALAAARELFVQRVRLEAIIRPAAFATVTAVVGSDLRDLAIRFYGNADVWDRIAKQNGLVQSIVPDGVDVLVIPLSLPDATDEKIGC